MALLKIDLKEIPEKSVIIVEEDVGSVERVFLHSIVADALKAGKKILYLSVNGSKEDIMDEAASYAFFDLESENVKNLTVEGHFHKIASVPHIIEGYDICIIDPFPLLMMQKDDSYVIDFLSTLRTLSRKNNMRFFLSMDHGISNERTESITRAMADGIIHFIEERSGRKIERFIHFPKMKGRMPSDEMTPILLTEDGIIVDTRQTIR